MILEVIEVGRPELAIGRQPVVELCERFWPDAVQAALRVCAHVDEPSVFEDAEMCGEGGYADEYSNASVAKVCRRWYGPRLSMPASSADYHSRSRAA
jgi:hypothetical protein